MRDRPADQGQSGKTRSTSAPPFDAVILDLDGVVTETSSLHAAAWKEVFDEFLQRAAPDQPPFDTDEDYREYVDGMPRLDGVRGFLESRGIELPEGEDDDSLDDQTVKGIGNAKNKRFRELLDENGPRVFDDAVAHIRDWKARGLSIAVVSASRNCAAILKAAGLSDLFDVRVDGTTIDELGMGGKPEPDMYVEAARRLGVAPERAIVFEDALAGVEAARQGGFGLVVGVGPEHMEDQLRNRGADTFVNTVGDFMLSAADETSDASSSPRCLLDSLDAFSDRLKDHRPALFLDYDGTLTPIVERPELARLDDEMRNVLQRLARNCPVAIVSGRDLADVEKLVGVEGIIYAGSHGFDIRGPGDLAIEHAVGENAAPQLDDVEEALTKSLDSIDGALIERKRFSIAVHYRNVEESDVSRVEDAVDEAIGNSDGLVKNHGKKVYEIQPDIDWNKGWAVLWLLEALDIEAEDVLPIYVGDDLTDEDAFKALKDRGVGIVVGLEDRATKADYGLHDVDEVRRFLEWLHEELEQAAT